MRAECVVWTSVDSNMCKTDPTAKATKLLPLQAHPNIRVLDVSYSRVLGQRPTFYCPLFFYEKQAIRRRQFAAIDCDVFMCGSYRIAGSELPRGLGAYVSPYNNNNTTGRWSHRCYNGPSLFKQIPTFSFIVDR